MKLDNLNCSNCGAPLDVMSWNSGKCPYCGTTHRIETPYGIPRIVEVHSGPVQTFEARVQVSEMMAKYMDERDLADYTIEELKHQLADGLVSMMEVQQSFDPRGECVTYRGRVRVVPPGYRFY